MIATVIVTYKPDIVVLEELLTRIKPQVDHIVIVDNSSVAPITKDVFFLVESFGAEIIQNQRNLGLAAALNQGIQWCLERKADHILLMDQDSLPNSDMVENLHKSLVQATNNGLKVAAVGPKYSDVKGLRSSPFVRLRNWRISRVDVNGPELIEVDHLITSGSLLPVEVIDSVGGMEESLFIDYVDTEWCLRAKGLGYHIFGVPNAKMLHNLGDKYEIFWGKELVIHSPLRYYYIIRNGLWLLARPWVSNHWRVADARRIFLMYIVFSLFIGDRVNNWKMMTRGIWHAITGRMGDMQPRS